MVFRTRGSFCWLQGYDKPYKLFTLISKSPSKFCKDMNECAACRCVSRCFWTEAPGSYRCTDLETYTYKNWKLQHLLFLLWSGSFPLLWLLWGIRGWAALQNLRTVAWASPTSSSRIVVTIITRSWSRIRSEFDRSRVGRKLDRWPVHDFLAMRRGRIPWLNRNCFTLDSWWRWHESSSWLLPLQTNWLHVR
jgi:hypothetical protein